MIRCNKCKGKVFVDFTFDSMETFCLRCGKRTFGNQMDSRTHGIISRYISKRLNG